jgi:galactokinase
MDRHFFAPGRVNLIGEHTDYNGGYVFPCALNLGTYCTARLRGDNTILLKAEGYEPIVEISTGALDYDPAHKWANYPKGVAYQLIKAGHKLGGFELYFKGDLPSGAGLSSSASIELCTFAALNALFNLNIPQIEGVKLCQRAENQYIGVNCGIMDQFASGMGRAGHAILLDCNTLEYSYAPLNLTGVKIIMANTNAKRGLADTKYNERRAECEAALTNLRQKLDVDALCNVTPQQFEANKDLIANPVHRKRAEHAIYENARTIKAAEALNAGDIATLGRLMNESHVSLRDLYEVTGLELDALAEAAWNCSGVYGSRMTGAGFGGCTVSLVKEESVEGFKQAVGEAYTKKTGLEADFYTAETGNGAGEIFN